MIDRSTAYGRIVWCLQDRGLRVVCGQTTARAQCPVHESRGLTLSIRSRAGRATIHCFAGCEDVAILEALLLGVRDLFDEPGKTRPNYTPPKPAPTPWDEAMAGLGLRKWPPIDHVLDRMLVEEQKLNRPTDLPDGAS